MCHLTKWSIWALTVRDWQSPSNGLNDNNALIWCSLKEIQTVIFFEFGLLKVISVKRWRWSLWPAPGSRCVFGERAELKALCHQYYRDVRSALTLLYFQQIPLNTKLIPCDWLWLSMLHCSSSPFVRLVSCTQTKLSCHSGQYSAARCFDNPHKVGIFDFFPGKKKKRIKVGH